MFLVTVWQNASMPRLACVHLATDSDALGRRRACARALRAWQRSTPRIFCPPPLAAGAELDLAPGAAHHVLRVLRLQVGDALTLFDGAGGEYRAELAQATRRGVAVHVIEHRDIERESPLTVTLVQGLAAADRMDYVVQKAVELGAAAIAPVMATRSVARLEGARAERRVEHWRQIVIAACEQSGRNRLPQVHVPCALATWLRTAFAGGAARAARCRMRPPRSVTWPGRPARWNCWSVPRVASRRRNRPRRAPPGFGRYAWGHASCARRRRARPCLRR